jgi:hypothetical protein
MDWACKTLEDIRNAYTVVGVRIPGTIFLLSM